MHFIFRKYFICIKIKILSINVDGFKNASWTRQITFTMFKIFVNQSRFSKSVKTWFIILNKANVLDFKWKPILSNYMQTV